MKGNEKNDEKFNGFYYRNDYFLCIIPMDKLIELKRSEVYYYFGRVHLFGIQGSTD